MQEIRFHGRGGQGTVVASILLAKALFKAGNYVQTFPFFGVERRGAPVEAYVRYDLKKIYIRTNVYEPDAVVVQDRTLINNIEVTKGLKTGGRILINAPVIPDQLKVLSDFKIAYVDAVQIAIKNRLGTRTHPIINTAMVGAFAKILGILPIEAVTEAISEEISEKQKGNIVAAETAFEQVKYFDPEK
jgi:pyruvate ferredoxin oxidoreductase gamma subunit/2-oxoisovalerate ferredoxin oxidoreductase gamma subunit